MKIIEEETKKAGLLLAAIGILLGVLLNIFLITQQIGANNSTPQNSSGISSVDLTILKEFFDYQLIFAEVALLLLSAICLVAVLAIIIFRTKHFPVINYQELMDRTISDDTLKTLQITIINANKQSTGSLDGKIKKSDFWYLFGIFAFLAALFWLVVIIILILINTSSLETIVKVVAITLSVLTGVALGFAMFKLVIRGTIAEAGSEPKPRDLCQSP